MKKFWIFLGRAAFWISLPLLHVYLRIRSRTRVLVVSEGKVLVTKGWLGSGKWVLPGGGLHSSEKAIDGALRELREETGVSLVTNQLRPVGEARFKHHGLRFKYAQFIAEIPVTVTLSAQRWEIVEAIWLDIEELTAENSEPDVLTLLDAWRARL